MSTKTPADAADELSPIDNLYDENQHLRAENEKLWAAVAALRTYRSAAADAGHPMLPWPALELALDALP